MKTLLLYFVVIMYYVHYLHAQLAPSIDIDKFKSVYDLDNMDGATPHQNMLQFAASPAPNISLEREREVLIVGKGEFGEMKFPFQNFQNILFQDYKEQFPKRSYCTNQYISCLLTQSVPSPVCAFNHAKKSKQRYRGYFSANSYCDVYFDNCKLGFRAWRILGVGVCRFEYGTSKDDLFKGRRMQGGKLRPKNVLVSKIISALKNKNVPNKKPTK